MSVCRCCVIHTRDLSPVARELLRVHLPGALVESTTDVILQRCDAKYYLVLLFGAAQQAFLIWVARLVHYG